MSAKAIDQLRQHLFALRIEIRRVTRELNRAEVDRHIALIDADNRRNGVVVGERN